MRVDKLTEMTRGWFVGSFEPTVMNTNEVEIGVKEYVAGAHEPAHFHKIATELTVIISGEVQMNGKRYIQGDIITIEPGEATDFMAITNAVTVVVKRPGVLDDKYLV